MRRADVINVSVARVLQSSSAGSHGAAFPFPPPAITPSVKVGLVRSHAIKEYLDLALGGAVIVTAAGNNGASLDFPDDLIVYPGSINLFGINVANVNTSPLDTLVTNSNFGIGVSGQSAGASIAAPGVALDCLGAPPAGCTGTSSSAALISGGLLLVLSADPGLAAQPCHLRDRLERNADTILGLVGSVRQGRRINLAAAVANTNRTPTCGSVP